MSTRTPDKAINPDQWVVHKFGGTSVGSASCMRKCIDIIKPMTRIQRVAVVVSAMGGKPKVTDLLLDMVHAAAAGRNDEISRNMEIIQTKHRECVTDMLRDAPSIQQSILSKIESDLKDISDLLRAVHLMRMAHEQILELVSGYGEIWSATIMAEAFQQEGLPFKFLNARDVLFINEDTKVYWSESEAKLSEYIIRAEEEFSLTVTDSFSDFKGANPLIMVPHLLITGYVASTLDGVATTLKRDGSDYSASIFGKMLRSTSITIWTDVSGVYSADPRRVPEAQILPEVSFTEAIELAYFGAKVIHPKTMTPAIEASIPIYIRNTFEPELKGTRIYLSSPPEKRIIERTVCGFTTVDNISLLNIEGTGMIGVPGVAHRLFGALTKSDISVMFIAAASSEHSICFATNTIYSEKALDAIKEAFFYELKQGFISNITVINGCSIIAAVGESMCHTPGVAGLFFGALGNASVNLLSISQGCDERNISAVVYTSDATRALRAVHSAFWLSSVELNIGIVGTGRVGCALLQTLIDNLNMLENRLGIKIKIRGVANSRRMLLGEDLSGSLRDVLSYFDTANRTSPHMMRKNSSLNSMQELEQALCCGGSSSDHDKKDTDLELFLEHIKSGPTPHSIIVDASSSFQVAEQHPSWLLARAHVVTANKLALSANLDLYNSLFSALRTSHHMYMSEVTIGASLPVRTTLNDILCSGDAIHAIVGIMNISANTVVRDISEEGLTFTQALIKTYKTGIFEDDPFSDLNGSDSAVKALIISRELGYATTLNDLVVEPVAKTRIIDSWSKITDEFAEEDKEYATRAENAAKKGCTLRYIQRIECDPPAQHGLDRKGCTIKVTSRLEEVPMDSTLAQVKGYMYQVSFHTDRYSQSPLTIQGPLTDPAGTASGLIADILRISKSIGAKDRGPTILKSPEEDN